MSVCLSYLLQEQSDIVVDEVPPGVKENMWFLVKHYVSPDGVFLTSFGTIVEHSRTTMDGKATT